MFDQILELYGLHVSDYKIAKFGSGLINHTWKICGPENYILQHINAGVFKDPEAIAENVALLETYLTNRA